MEFLSKYRFFIFVGIFLLATTAISISIIAISNETGSSTSATVTDTNKPAPSKEQAPLQPGSGSGNVSGPQSSQTNNNQEPQGKKTTVPPADPQGDPAGNVNIPESRKVEDNKEVVQSAGSSKNKGPEIENQQNSGSQIDATTRAENGKGNSSASQVDTNGSPTGNSPNQGSSDNTNPQVDINHGEGNKDKEEDTLNILDSAGIGESNVESSSALKKEPSNFTGSVTEQPTVSETVQTQVSGSKTVLPDETTKSDVLANHNLSTEKVSGQILNTSENQEKQGLVDPSAKLPDPLGSTVDSDIDFSATNLKAKESASTVVDLEHQNPDPAVVPENLKQTGIDSDTGSETGSETDTDSGTGSKDLNATATVQDKYEVLLQYDRITYGTGLFKWSSNRYFGVIDVNWLDNGKSSKIFFSVIELESLNDLLKKLTSGTKEVKTKMASDYAETENGSITYGYSDHKNLESIMDFEKTIDSIRKNNFVEFFKTLHSDNKKLLKSKDFYVVFTGLKESIEDLGSGINKNKKQVVKDQNVIKLKDLTTNNVQDLIPQKVHVSI